MIRNFILLLYAYGSVGYGYDSGGANQQACGRPYRSGRMYQPPCDLNRQSYCASAGTSYPWHAVKRFVRDNQGLMRRMYGDQRHAHVLRVELQNELDPLKQRQPQHKLPRYSKFDFDDDTENEVLEDEDFFLERYGVPRFLKDDVKNDDVLNTKFVYSEEPAIAIKLAGLKTAPHFRPTTQRNDIERVPDKYSEEKHKLKISDNVEDSSSTVTTTATTTTTTATTSTTETTSTSSSTVDDVTISTSDEEDSTTDTTTDQTTFPLKEADDRVGEAGQHGYASTERSEVNSDTRKPGAVLFQDMEDPTKKKMHVNYKMKGVNACPVKEEVVAPYWANNTRGEVLALLNMYPFEQFVHWEKCTFEHRQMYCREGCRCEQQYSLHRLLAYDPNNECRGIFSDWFRFPSCCVCRCYNVPPEFRVTSRSPRMQHSYADD